MAYKVGNRMQTNLLPNCIDDYVSNEDPVRIYDAFIEALDFHQLGIPIQPIKDGALTYWPKAMVKLLVYGYSYGIRSSRNLERACHHNLSFIWLMSDLKPAYRTIARFRDQHKEALKNILKQSVQMCMKLGLIEGNSLFVDSTVIKANASLSNTWDAKRCERNLERINKHIDDLMNETQKIDQSEESQGSLVKEQLGQAQERKAKVVAIAQELQKQRQKHPDKERIFHNTTDPECLKIHKSNKTNAGYNVQAVVDGKHGLIVHGQSTSLHNDYSQLATQIQSVQEILVHQPKEVSADSGYYSLADFQKIDPTITLVVPNPQDISKQRSIKKVFTKDQFVYDQTLDAYICPTGKSLPFRSMHKGSESRFYRASPKDCHSCERRSDCTSSSHGRVIKRLFKEDYKIALKQLFESPVGQKLYQRRKEVCELPFGHVKHNLKAQQFLLRGQAGTNAEANLLLSCFNLTRMIKLLGFVKLKEQLQSLPFRPNLN